MGEPLTFQQTRTLLNLIAEEGEEYAGLPMSIVGENLRIHPSYKFASVLNEDEKEDERFVLINSWINRKTSTKVLVFREDGTLRHMAVPMKHSLEMQFRTMGIASVAHDVQAEARALAKLGTLVRHHTFKSYLMVGQFLETSKKSGVTYLFRKLKPTLALKARPLTSDRDAVDILCALCLHPMGYYEDSFAGCLTPTDEVIAHLMLMRGDEADFWRQANQHPGWMPQAAI